jgi:hypothetical protein
VDGELRTLLAQTPIRETTMQTLYERYREEGRREGWQEGRREGGAAMLLRLIERRFRAPSPAVRERIACADADALLQWSERILTAEDLDSVLN